jgi:O-antigen ligase
MAAASLNARSPEDLRPWRRIGSRICVLGGLALLGAFWGSAIGVANWTAVYLCASLLGCVFIVRDFRVGVVLLILFLPLSRSYVFPREMLGITGLNPFNLLLLGTFGWCLLQGLLDGSLRRFMPHPLLWLYVVSIVIGGVLGSRHVDEIAPYYYMNQQLFFDNAASYLRDTVFKPLLMVVYALLVGGALSKTAQPEKFLLPILISIWVMSSMVIVSVFMSGVALSELASSLRGSLSKWLGMHENELGRLYAFAYALMLFTWAESKERGLKLALLASMGLTAVALALTFSRGAFLGFIVVNVLFLLWRRNATTLTYGVLLAAVALFLLPDAVYERLKYGFGSGVNFFSAGRIEGIWLPLLPEVLRSPVFGNGLSSILWSEAARSADGATFSSAGHPHNAYLEALLDTGIAGLLIVSAYFVHVWRGFRALSVDPALTPTLRGFYLGAAAGLASFLTAAFADSSLRPVPEQAFLWLAIGMMYGQRARKSAM